MCKPNAIGSGYGRHHLDHALVCICTGLVCLCFNLVTIQPGNAAILAASGAGRQDGGVPRLSAIGLNSYQIVNKPADELLFATISI